ncbi:hypothetical protein AHAS_Ahas19G0190400 [Arachis hypogaea]
MVQASLFSSLEHATSFARDLWFNKLPIQSWLNVFSADLHIDEAAKFTLGPIMLELEQFGRKYRRKFVFVFITSIEKKLSHQILEEVKTRYENSLSVELDITSREEFILIERKLARLLDQSDGTIKQLHLSVKDAMKPPNGRKIVLRFNERLQPVGNEAGILSGVLGLLGSEYTKFSICEKD